MIDDTSVEFCPSYLICVPIYAKLPHIEENLESINDWNHLFIVDNSENGWCKRFEERGARVVYKPQNIGVARAWNLGIMEGEDYTFFVSSSVKFHRGFQEVVDQLKQAIDKKLPGIEHGLFTQLGWHCNALTQKTIGKIGYFDENFYPSYVEDIDICRRLYLAGIHPDPKGKTLGGTVPCITIDAEPVEIAATLKRAGLQVNFAALNEYYRRKWNGNKPNEKFTKPFGKYDLSYFPVKTIEELKLEYGL